jgi:hypothetical protein
MWTGFYYIFTFASAGGTLFFQAKLSDYLLDDLFERCSR